MRTSVPHLAVTLTTAALCTFAATPSAYAGDATAEVTPQHIAPGEQVTVSVSCPATGAAPPQTMTASSQAFEQGSVQLQRVRSGGGQGLPLPSDGHEQSDPYGLTDPQGPEPDLGTDIEPDLGTVPGEEPDPGTGTDPGTSGTGDEVGIRGDARNSDARNSDGANSDGANSDGANGDDGENSDDGENADGAGAAYQGTARIATAASFEGGGPNAVGPDAQWAVDGACPDDGRWKATFTVTRTAHTPTHQPTHQPTHTATHTAHGVHAGRNGGFTDSPAALAAGGLLVTGAFGAAVHRLRRDRTSPR
ncbi:hypothetical protein [Streptomyces flavofungini]|uniref:Secreted protein n=1 Tax=Streptomyces flavofungini TaxID=68200 RepID=A0ABS0X541_9ACTN|nr:hypothetical protein [Streptomyces flavofungini]MBJ3808317.1 hypothetical protein [Streptomyces flavofungini]GHC57827.1 hypothetical protein GCM10010349_25970 [Streptomyces flavofungini]